MKTLHAVFTGAAPKLFVGILNITEYRVQLRCEVRGASPKPRVEWRDSDGNILPAEQPQVSHRDGRYDITLLTTVTRTNTNIFHCVATQEEIGHVTEEEIHVPDQLFESCDGVGVIVSVFASGFSVTVFASLLLFSACIKCC
ncbi:butyrophilin subfamily 2 member A1-like isoform X2 [Astatotilapia calliptera]|uniref:butyrophilin subfamily 2 member A1-like isoform X2 n=1 Tax=Astatotilapia calliptera TaxID=8154 RepID=UPI000E41C58E|nr:butyrophilin subfamily 2 member A1-like isoform X2 [Astatotilapia calliptera]